MPSVCFYFQAHQPFRLKKHSFFQSGTDFEFFDDEKNAQILRKVAHKCYLPTNRLMLKLIEKHRGKFKIAYSITGVCLEQLERYCPEALESFVDLAKTGCVEFLAETYYHSLAAIYDPREFKEQVQKHQRLMRGLFDCTPKVFRNTELIYSDDIGRLAGELGFQGVIAEGVDSVLGWRSPNFVYRVPGAETKLLLKNYRLSDDLAFRFSNKTWDGYPLTAEKYAKWIHSVTGGGDTVNLFLDYETFGEHQWEATGIFQFLEHLPAAVLARDDWSFLTPSETIAAYKPVAELTFDRLTSWADVDRDLSAWRGNRMQSGALEQVFELSRQVFDPRVTSPAAVDAWRKLLTADHFYYMCTKRFADGDVHSYFSPYESPYEAFINYMNVLRGLRDRLERGLDVRVKPPVLGTSELHP